MDDTRRADLQARLKSLRQLRLAAKIVTVLAVLITIGWIVVGIVALNDGTGPFTMFLMAALGLAMALAAAHTAWKVVPRGIAKLSAALEDDKTSDDAAGPERLVEDRDQTGSV